MDGWGRTTHSCKQQQSCVDVRRMRQFASTYRDQNQFWMQQKSITTIQSRLIGAARRWLARGATSKSTLEWSRITLSGNELILSGESVIFPGQTKLAARVERNEPVTWVELSREDTYPV
ncbi:hypothetical protein RRG08_008290 [Elysia crispata]|uniref:Uncharacterized protein n=1 Tax=Elysia crispata TaxID=231223 RepID=A0AAE1DIS9_9GAST|nr:hypothetical protein RRG08_008290 [Elysia crispata]